MTISDHAIDRFIERHSVWFSARYTGALDRKRAEQIIARLVRTATLHEVEGGKRYILRTSDGILLGCHGNEVRTVLPMGARLTNKYRPKKRRRRSC